MLSKLKIKNRLIITGVIFIIPALILVFFLISEKNISINFARKEILGAKYLDSISVLYKLFCKDNLSSAFRRAENSNSIADSEVRISASFNAGIPFRDEQKISGSEKKLLSGIKENPSKMKEPEYADSISSSFIELWSCAGDISNLILDPDLDSYYIMDFCVVKAPEGIDLTRKLIIASIGGTKQNGLDNNVRTNLTIISSLLKKI
jgi:hypothetical protein